MNPIPVSIVLFYQFPNLLWMQKRQTPGALQGKMEFPGGKIEISKNESPLDAAIREVQEEVGVSVPKEALHFFKILPYRDSSSNKSILLYLFVASFKECLEQGMPPLPIVPLSQEWITIEPHQPKQFLLDGVIPTINHDVIWYFSQGMLV